MGCEAADDGLAMSPLALDHLDLRLGQVRVDPDPMLPRQPGTAIEELVRRLVRDGRRHRHPDAPALRPVPAPDGAIGQVEQSLGRRRLHGLDRFTQMRRQQIEQPRYGLVEHDVGHGRREHDAHPDVRVRAHDRLERLVGDRGERHEEVVGRRAPGLEHLDGADGRREVIVLRPAKPVVRGGVRQEVLERPVACAASDEMAPGVRMRIRQTGQHDPARRVDPPHILRDQQAPGRPP